MEEWGIQFGALLSVFYTRRLGFLYLGAFLGGCLPLGADVVEWVACRGTRSLGDFCRQHLTCSRLHVLCVLSLRRHAWGEGAFFWGSSWDNWRDYSTGGDGGVLACLWTYAPLPRFCVGKSDQVVDADQGPPSGMNFNLLINHNAPMPLFLFLLFYCALSLCFPMDP